MRWKFEMEICDRSRRIGDILNRLPSSLRRIVAHPIHQILEFSAAETKVEDRIDLKLRQTVHLDGRRGHHDTTRECVGHMRLQQADMEHRMDMHCGWKVEAIG